MGLILGVLGFPCNQNNRGSSGAYVTCIYRGPSVKINMRKTLHSARRSWAHLFCMCFCACGRQKPEDPQFEPMADDAITRHWGSLVYIYDKFRGIVTPLHMWRSYNVNNQVGARFPMFHSFGFHLFPISTSWFCPSCFVCPLFWG